MDEPAASSPPITLMIGGAQKCGTTSLLGYLAQHPAICAHGRGSELTYFADPVRDREGYDRAFQTAFPHFAGESHVLAKSVAILWDPAACHRLQEHNSEVRLVFCFRNPVDRAYSAYWFARRRGWETHTRFEDALNALPTRLGTDPRWTLNLSYKAAGHYAEQLERVMDRFGTSRIRTILLEDLQADPEAVCKSLFAWVPGIDANVRVDTSDRENTSARARSAWLAHLTSRRTVLAGPKRMLKRILPGAWVRRINNAVVKCNETPWSPPPMRPETRQALTAYFEPYNAELERLLGRDLSAWK